jgi:Transposase domain (DUF772)
VEEFGSVWLFGWIWREQVTDFARRPGVRLGFLAFWDSGFGRFMIPSTARFAVGESHEPTARRPSGRPKIIDLRHPLVRLAGTIDWDFLARRFSPACWVGPGQPPLPTRLVAGLFILKHMHNLSDEVLCDRWVENPYFQYFCGEVVFRHEAPFDRSSLTRWRQSGWP